MTAANQTNLNLGSESCNTMAGRTQTTKGRNGWESQTDIELGDMRLLRITTKKSDRGGVQSAARVHQMEGDFLRTELFGDFSRSLAINTTLRCLERTVAAQHHCVLQTLESLLTEIAAHYAAKPKKAWVVANGLAMDDTSVVADFCSRSDAEIFLADLKQPACILRRCADGTLSVNF